MNCSTSTLPTNKQLIDVGLLIVISFTLGCVTVNPQTVTHMPDFRLCEFLGPGWISTVNERKAIYDELSKRGVECRGSYPVASRSTKQEDQKLPERTNVEEKSTCTGFFVSTYGYMLTNKHVIDNCQKLFVKTINGSFVARPVTSDSVNDLAIIKVSIEEPVNASFFRVGSNVRIGDDVTTIGFPFGELLGTSIKASEGTVSALNGISNDTSKMQITAPIQPGNSGGPLLDSSGNVVGVISAKLNEIATAMITGSLPQNVNFAVKTSTALTFMDVADIKYQTQESRKKLDRADIIEAAKKYTALVECN